MSDSLISSLPRFDRNLMRLMENIVPAAERADWSRSWQAELWHVHQQYRRRQSFRATSGLSVGLTLDALWLRGESLRRAFHGTPTLCLVSLVGLCLASVALAAMLSGDRQALDGYVGEQFQRFVFEAPLVLLVGWLTSRRHTQHSGGGRVLPWVGRQMFLVVKTSLILLLAFCLSSDACEPLYASLPSTGDVFQTLLFVIFALCGLRWVFADQARRCAQCLRLLATPARVGRPSNNLLEWNGTELVCQQGHGLLSVPEMETSWCRSSQWVGQTSSWDEAASA